MHSSYSTEAWYQSPVGQLKFKANSQALTGVYFADKEEAVGSVSIIETPEHPVLKETFQQMDEYFKGQRNNFDLALAPAGSAFQQSVWQELLLIPYGQTISYGELAQRLGDFNKVRAVGTANGRNPIPIIIPCHRVIGANKKLIGYSGGIDLKKKLLQHEGAILL